MGTWAAGPFSNDAAMDFVGDLRDQLVETIESFVRAPQLDRAFDRAFAAVALLNLLAAGTRAYRPKPECARPWRQAMLACFDARIEEFGPDPVRRRRRGVPKGNRRLNSLR